MPLGTHRRPFGRWGKHAPRAVIVSEEKDHQRPCRSRSLDADIASLIRPHTTEPLDSNRYGWGRRKPLVDQPAQGFFTAVHRHLLQPHSLLTNCIRMRASLSDDGVNAFGS